LVNGSGWIGRSRKAVQATSSQLAARTGTTERYVREWLEHHAASELLVVDDPRAEPRARRYWLPPEYIPVLADPEDVRYEAYTASTSSGAVAGFQSWWRRFRMGNAPPPLPWEPEGREQANRALFLNLLGTEWLPAIVDVDARLRAEVRINSAGDHPPLVAALVVLQPHGQADCTVTNAEARLVSGRCA
jgi:hypothetical protein